MRPFADLPDHTMQCCLCEPHKPHQPLCAVLLLHSGDSADQDVQSTGQKRKAAACAAKCDDRLEVEVDFHWVGEPNISFFVEMAMAGWVRGQQQHPLHSLAQRGSTHPIQRVGKI